MLACWNEVPKERPTFSDLRETIEGLMNESEGYIDFDEIDEDNIYYKVPSFKSHDEENSNNRDTVESEKHKDEQISSC